MGTGKATRGGSRMHAGLSASARHKTGEHIGDHLGPKLAPHVSPWLLWAGAMPLALFLWLLVHFGGPHAGGRPLWLLILAASGGLLTWQSGQLTHDRGRWGRRHPATTVGLVTAWLTWAAARPFGPLEPAAALPWGICGPVLAFSWNARVQQRGSASAVTVLNPEEAKLEALPRKLTATALDKLGLTGSRWYARLDRDKFAAQGHWELPEGMTTEQLQAKQAELASVLGVGKEQVTVTRTKGDERRPVVRATTKDMLEQHTDWPGIGNIAGRGVYDTYPLVGWYEDGDEVRIPIFTDTGACHYLVMGMNGSGKSTFLRILVLDLLCRCTGSTDDPIIWLSDTLKYHQIPEVIRRCFDWGVHTDGDTRAMVSALKRAIADRARWLGDHGYDEWEPGCGLSPMLAYFEEASAVGDVKGLTVLANAARSVGISLWFSLQRATWDQLDKSVSAQLGQRICFGTEDDTEAGFCLPEWVMDAGATPGEWRNEFPGRFYVTGKTFPRSRGTMPAKTGYLPKGGTAEFKAIAEPIVARYLPGRHRLDDVTAAAAGPVYAAYQAQKTQAGGTLTLVRPAAARTDADDTPPASREEQEMRADEGMRVSDARDDDDLNTDEDEALPPDPDPGMVDDEPVASVLDDGDGELRPAVSIPLCDPPGLAEKVSPAEADAIFVAQLRSWFYVDKDRFVAADCYDAQKAACRSRPWIYTQISKNVDAGRLEALEAEPGEQAAMWRITDPADWADSAHAA